MLYSLVLGKVGPLINKNGIKMLDCACGSGRWGSLFKLSFNHIPYLIGVELDKRRAVLAKLHGSYDEIIICDCRNLPFRDKAFDLTVSIETLEHLSKADGHRFLTELNRISMNILITTPQYFRTISMPTGHRSIWKASELKKGGYKVRGYGFKYSNVFPQKAKMLIDALFTPLSYFIPQLAWGFVCTKMKIK
jgi:SAM-dependent methyltransferase